MMMQTGSWLRGLASERRRRQGCCAGAQLFPHRQVPPNGDALPFPVKSSRGNLGAPVLTSLTSFPADRAEYVKGVGCLCGPSRFSLLRSSPRPEPRGLGSYDPTPGSGHPERWASTQPPGISGQMSLQRGQPGSLPLGWCATPYSWVRAGGGLPLSSWLVFLLRSLHAHILR